MLAIGTPIVIQHSENYEGRTGVVIGYGEATIRVRLKDDPKDHYFFSHKVVPTNTPPSHFDAIAAEYVALTNLKPYGSNE